MALANLSKSNLRSRLLTPAIPILLLAGMVLAVALAARLIGLSWGLPNEIRHQSLHPDELLILRHAQMKPFFKPEFYNYGTLYLTLLKTGGTVGTLTGHIPSPDEEPWRTDRAWHLVGRLISACLGAFSTLFVFFALRYVVALWAAVIGALVFALAPGHTVHSHFQTTDVTATFFIAMGVWLFVKWISTGCPAQWNYAVGLGMVSGLAGSTKYIGILFILPVIGAGFVHLTHSRLLWCGVAGVSCLIAFLIGTPGIVLESEAFWSAFIYEWHHTAEGHGIVFSQTPSGWVFHGINLMSAFSPLATIIGIIGLGVGLIKREKWALLLLFGVFYYIVIARAEVKFLRYVLPLLPLLAFGVGITFHASHAKGASLRVLNGLALIALAFSMQGANGTVRLLDFLTTPDPRDRAALWLREEMEKRPSATVGFVTDPWFYTPPLFPDTGIFSLRADSGEVLHGADSRLYAMRKYDSRLLRYGEIHSSREDWDSRLLSEYNPTFVVFSSFEFLDYDRIQHQNMRNFLARLLKDYSLIAIFWGREPLFFTPNPQTPLTYADVKKIFTSRFPLLHDMMYIQPTILVFQKNPSPASLTKPEESRKNHGDY